MPLVAGLTAVVALAGVASGAGGRPVPPQKQTQVASGSTAVADWTMAANRSRKHGLCLVVQVRSRTSDRTSGGSGCGWIPPIRWNALTVRRLGTFAFGAARKRIAKVRVRYTDGTRHAADFFAGPPALGFDGRFWMVARPVQCSVVSIRALNRRGRTVKLVRMPRTPVDPGQPDPWRDCPNRR